MNIRPYCYKANLFNCSYRKYSILLYCEQEYDFLLLSCIRQKALLFIFCLNIEIKLTRTESTLIILILSASDQFCASTPISFVWFREPLIGMLKAFCVVNLLIFYALTPVFMQTNKKRLASCKLKPKQ